MCVCFGRVQTRRFSSDPDQVLQKTDQFGLFCFGVCPLHLRICGEGDKKGFASPWCEFVGNLFASFVLYAFYCELTLFIDLDLYADYINLILQFF